VSDVVLIVMVVDAVAVLALVSVTVTDTVNVPWLAYFVVKVAPDPLAGVPPVAVHANVYGVVPPVAVAVNVTVALTLAVVGPAILTPRVRAAIVMVAVVLATTAFESVALTDTVYVPFTL